MTSSCSIVLVLLSSPPKCSLLRMFFLRAVFFFTVMCQHPLPLKPNLPIVLKHIQVSCAEPNVSIITHSTFSVLNNKNHPVR